MTGTPLQQLLSRQCRALHDLINPLLEPVAELQPLLQRGLPDDSRAERLQASREALQSLQQRLAEQEVHLLVFGPLKSGKSTLMNAICASYVSEVTALPAYPCMVHVQHGSEPRYLLHRHDGEAVEHADERAVADAIADGHERLATAVREAEAAGEPFEPVRHAPDALRRIDAWVPAGELEGSGAVLVDTPGLYTRMRFGYDQMTREYREGAACAIFVVKADNLFLDNVFVDFEQLLAAFRDIFLVVNLDSSKQDLQADGSLQPSLEHADPQAVVNAFENLAMSEPMRQARAEGRLRIYPVDLLRAASARMQGQPAASDFGALLEDFAAYLNDNEPLKAFWVDSLARAREQFEVLSEVLSSDWVQELDDFCADLGAERDQLQQAAQSLGRLQEQDWRTLVLERAAAVPEGLATLQQEARDSAHEQLRAEVSGWFGSAASLSHLASEGLLPVLEAAREELVRLVVEEYQRVLSAGALEAALDSDTQMDLLYAQIGLEPLLREALDTLTIEQTVPEARLRFDLRSIPVRRELSDWLLLRRAITVRRRLFGNEENPSHPVAVADKQKRLGDAARQVLQNQAERALEPVFGSLAAEALHNQNERAAEALAEALGTLLAERADSVATALETRSAEHERMQALVQELRAVSQQVQTQTEQLGTLAAQDPFAARRADEGPVLSR